MKYHIIFRAGKKKKIRKLENSNDGGTSVTKTPVHY